MTSTAASEPSLSSRAMLCSLSISVWSARKHDAEASEEIARQHGAQSDAGRYHKVLLPKAALAEIQKIVSEARQEHYFMTLPWDDNGYRVLPAAAYMDHTERMRALSNLFTPALETLVSQFSQLVEDAKVRLGGLFRAGDYPAPDELRSKFSFEVKVVPLPDGAAAWGRMRQPQHMRHSRVGGMGREKVRFGPRQAQGGHTNVLGGAFTVRTTQLVLAFGPVKW